MKKQKPKRNDMVTVNGGLELTVQHLAASALDDVSLQRLEKFQPLLGTSEVVKVRQIPISQMARFANAIISNNEGETIELYCGKEPGWTDTLTVESVNEAAEKGLELNHPFFRTWYLRQLRWKETQKPGVTAELEQKLEELRKAMQSQFQSSAPTSPSTTN